MNIPKSFPSGSAALCIGIGTLLCGAAAAQSSWPQWRGPNRDGIAADAKLELGETARKLWTRDIGIGYSCVSIEAGRLYTLGHDRDAEQDTIWCLDAATGEDIWSHTFAAATMAKAHRGGTLTTPSIDGERVFVSQRQGRLFCFEAATGEIQWQKDLTEEFGVEVPTWGFSASPLVLDEMIVMNVGVVVAFDRAGEVIWKTDRDLGHAYATPADFERDGKAYFAVFAGDGLAVLERATGKVVDRVEWKTSYDVNAATPIVVGDRIFVSSGYNRGCAVYSFDGEKLEQRWESKVMRNHMSGCVAVGEYLYGYDEGTVKCIDLDGNEVWSERGFGKCALLVAGDKLVLLGRRGSLVLAAVSPDGYQEIGRIDDALGDKGEKWTTPVALDGVVYVRSSLGELVAIDARPAG